MSAECDRCYEHVLDCGCGEDDCLEYLEICLNEIEECNKKIIRYLINSSREMHDIGENLESNQLHHIRLNKLKNKIMCLNDNLWDLLSIIREQEDISKSLVSIDLLDMFESYRKCDIGY